MTFFRHHIHVRWRLNHVKKNPDLSKLMYFCCYFFWTFNLSYSSTLWLFYTISLSICAHTSCSEWPGMWVAVDGNSCRSVKQSSLLFFLIDLFYLTHNYALQSATGLSGSAFAPSVLTHKSAMRLLLDNILDIEGRKVELFVNLANEVNRNAFRSSHSEVCLSGHLKLSTHRSPLHLDAKYQSLFDYSAPKWK